MVIIKYNLNDNVIEEEKNSKISCFLPTHLKDLIKDLDENYYILGVQYVDEDIQVGITGSSNYKENWKRTLTRELAEELKLYPNFDKIESEKLYEEDGKNWFCCKLNIDNTKISLNQDFKQEFKSRAWGKKIGIVVYGTYEKLYEILNSNYNEYKPNDNISHIVMVNVGLIKKYINFFTNNNDFFLI